jgi:hypothetical protein
MSKRYGRNQKRRARARIAELEQSENRLTAHLEGATQNVRRLSADLQGTSQNLHALRQVLESAMEIAGPMSVLFPAQPLEVKQKREGRTHWQVDVPDRESWQQAVMTYRDIHQRTLKIMDLDLLVSRIHRDALSQALHCRVKFADKEVCYADSALARAIMGRKNLEQAIARELAQVLTERLRGGR